MMEDTSPGPQEDGVLEDAPVLVGKTKPETTEYDSSETSEIPIDRGWAWMTVLGCFGIHVFVVGGVKSLGVLIVEIRDRFEGMSAKEMGLVQGIIVTLMMGLGLFSNLLAARFTCRLVVVLGGLLATIGFVLTAFATQLWMIYLTYSLMTGIGFGLSYVPSIVFVGSHFKKRLTLANGLSLAGSGIGSFALPNLMRVMLKEYGLPGCCMLMGALMLHVCICGLLFRPHANYRKKSKTVDVQTDNFSTYLASPGSMIVADNFTDKEMSNDNIGNLDTNEFEVNCEVSPKCEEFKTLLPNGHDKSKLFISNGNAESRSTDGTDSATRTERTLFQSLNNTSSQKTSTLPPSEKIIQHQNGLKPQTPGPKRTSQFEWSLLSSPVFIPYLLFALFVNFGYPNIFFMLPVHAENIGESRDSSALLMSFIGLSDLMGRLVIGWFMDFKLIERRYVLVTCALVSGILSLLMPVFTTFGGLAVYATLYGFCAGSYITLLPVILSDLLGPEKLTSSFGMAAMAYSVPLIPSPLICGQIRDSTGSWVPAFLFVGSFAVVASMFPVLQICLQKRQKTSKAIVDITIPDGNEVTKV